MAQSYNEELSIGDRIGRYEILSILGQGSMGMVYKCRHDILGRVVAIKTLRLRSMTDERTQKRFVREAQMANRLDHPNLIGLIDFGNMANGDPYLVMEYVSGVTLYEIMKRERYIIPERAVPLFAQICDGLYHAHQRGVIHRDLKPANILVIQNENAPESVKIVDLGVAKIVHGGDEEEAEAITMTGEVCGSPIYLSPEQCMYQELDARTDIYSLGVCLYECLTGQPPLRGATVYDTIYMHVHDQPRPFSEVAPNLGIPARLEEVIFRCLSKQPKDRYETMMQLKHDLISATKAQAPDRGINVLPPEQLFGSADKPKSKKVSGEMKTGSGALQGNSAASPASKSGAHRPLEPGARSGAHRPAGYVSGAYAAEVQQDSVPTEDPPPPVEPVRKRSAAQGKTARKSAETKAAKPGSEKDGIFITLDTRTIIMFCGCALVFFGLGLAFTCLFLKGPDKTTQATPPTTPAGENPFLTGQTPPPAAVPTSASTAPPTIPFSNQAAVIPLTQAQSGQGAKAPTAGQKKGQHKAGAAAKNQKTSQNKKPQKGAPQVLTGGDKYDDMARLLDGGSPGPGGRQRIQDGSQGRFFSSIQNQRMMMPPARPLGNSNRAQLMKTQNTIVTLRNKFASSLGGQMGGQGGGGQNPLAAMMAQQGGGGSGQNPLAAMMAQQSGGQAPQGGGNPLAALMGQGGGGSKPFLAGGGQQPSQSPGEDPGRAAEATKLAHEATQLCQSRQFGSACQKFAEAQKIAPPSVQPEIAQMYPYALHAYAVDLNKAGKYAEAVSYARKAVEMTPGNDMYHRDYAKFSQNLEAQKSGKL